MVCSRTSLARSLREASRSELRQRIVQGFAVDPRAIEGWAYRGTSLGLPKAVEGLSWKTFQKTFWREPATGRLLGWNVRLEQDGIDAPSRPVVRDGHPLTVWHYEVIEPGRVPAPHGFDRGLIIDYSRGPNGRFEPVRLGKDPLVSLAADGCDELLGVTYLVVAGRCVETPTYFVLERDHPIDHVPAIYGAAGVRRTEPSGGRAASTELRAFEREWADALFEAVLPGDDALGLPAYRSIDRSVFWRCLADAPAPSFGLGLRTIVYALTFLPLGRAEHRRPFYQLTLAVREQLLDELTRDPRFVVRQMVTTLKTLAALAYFDDPAVRARVGADPPGAPSDPTVESGSAPGRADAPPKESGA